MAKPPQISEAEWEVMELVWQRNPITAAEVISALAHKNWAANTVRTLLARLVKKRVLIYEPEGNRYLYRPAVQREECVKGEVDSLLGRVFGGAVQPLLLHFAKHRKLNAAEIRELRAFLDQEDSKP